MEVRNDTYKNFSKVKTRNFENQTKTLEPKKSE